MNGQMPDSPEKNSTGVLALVVKSAGEAVKETLCRVVSITVDRKVNRIPWAQLVLLDGDMGAQTFDASSAEAFAPGAEIEIEAGYGDMTTPIFTGVVVRHGINIHAGGSHLVVECRDKAVALTTLRKNTNHTDQADSEIIEALVGATSGLSVEIDPTTPAHARMVQYQATDWDFILARAEANGLVVTVDGGTLTVKPPQLSEEPVLTVSWGEDLIRFRAEMDARTQVEAARSVAWDPKTLEIMEESGTAPECPDAGNVETADLARVVGAKQESLRTAVPMESEALKAWADGRLLRAGLARIRGTMRFQGSAAVLPGDLVALSGVGARFEGTVFVSTVHHDIANGNWFTDVEFGLAPDAFCERDDLSPPQAAGLLPGVDGLQVGIVTRLDEDPAREGRIQVKVPVMEHETEGIWARLATWYATNGSGSFFIPEKGDEVVLGFFNSDPRHPVILGSLHGSRQVAPEEVTADNFTKALVTREKLTLAFDEEKKAITLETPGENRIVISDDARGIRLEDANGNGIRLDDSGIAITSASDITLKASGEVTVAATGAVTVQSGADVGVTGMNLNLTADVGLTVKGSATAEVSASGQTTIKGAMVMIN